MTADELAALDAETAVTTLYPAWFQHRYGDNILERALAAGSPKGSQQ